MASSREGSEDPTKIELLKDALYQAVVDNGTDTRLWNQKDLLELDVIPDRNLFLLMKAVQGLCQDFLFKAMNDGRYGLCWRYRAPEDASKYKQLNQDQIMVYELIDDAGADGIWARSLKLRLNMHDSVLKQCIKHLESKGYIRDMKSVENIGKKMYIKATLRPSDRATGGPWYTDATLDEAFIESLQDIVFQAICKKSSYLSRHGGGGAAAAASGSSAGGAGSASASASSLRQPRKGVIRGAGAAEPATAEAAAAAGAAGPDESVRGKKRSADAMVTDQDDGGLATTTAAGTASSTAATRKASDVNGHGTHHRRVRRREVLLPMPAGYMDYPTVRQIAELIEQSGVTNNTTLSEADVQQLVDVLVYDGLLEPVRLPGSHEYGYRALNVARLGTDQDTNGGAASSSAATASASSSSYRGLGATVGRAPGAGPPKGAPSINNGYTEMPCGLCPVFDLCEDGGPVNPSNCVYFNQWLGIEESVPVPLAAGITAEGATDTA